MTDWIVGLIGAMGLMLTALASPGVEVGGAPPGGRDAHAPIPLPTPADIAPRDYPGVHNAVAYHVGFVSGSVPEGDAGMDTLRAMGIKTIISVDGAEPDVPAAKARGMRYIHLPIGYNGFDEERKLELVRATRDAMKTGPVYMHCHHGRHRSAGAAATVAASLGWAGPDEMVARMKVSGTAPGYKGLYACASKAAVLAADVIDAVPADFPEVWKPSGFVKGMVEIDEVFEHLKAIDKAGWVTPKDHPDLVPAAEAGRLADLFRVLIDGDYVARKPDDFAALMRENQTQAESLEALLAAASVSEDGRTPSGGRGPEVSKLTEQFKLINATCKDCHVKYRD